MSKKYASLTTLQTFLDNLKNIFAKKNHTHTISEITDISDMGSCTVDTELSSTSNNPVANSVINAEFDAVSEAMGALEAAIDKKANSSHTHDDIYYTEFEIDTKLSNKADVSHIHTIENVSGLQSALEETRTYIDEATSNKTNLSKSEVNDAMVYTKDTPSNSAPYAKINKIGGMTRKCTNLFNFNAHENNGRTSVIYVTPNQNIYRNGKAGADFVLKICGASDELIASYSAYEWTSNTALLLPAVALYIKLEGYAEPEFYIGYDSDTTYKPYFEGLRSAPVTEVESVGANLIAEILDGYYDVNNNGVFVASNWKASPLIPCIPLIDYTLSNIEVNTAGYWSFYDSNKNQISYASISNSLTVTTPNGCFYMAFYSRFTGDPMLNKGTTALPYAPFTKNILPIPEEVRPKNGIPNGAYDFIEWCADGTIKSHQRVGCVDMGTLNWSLLHSSVFYTSIDKAIGLSNMLCANYSNAQTGFSAMVDKEITGSAEHNLIYVKDSAYTDATAFKSAMSGVMLYYEFAEPIITDISDILPADNFIGVEGGGTITFKNEFGYDVPSEVTYYLDNNDKISANEFVGDLMGVAARAENATNAENAKNAEIATKANKDGNGNDIASTYETKTNAQTKFDEVVLHSDTNFENAKKYTDTVASGKSNTNHTHDDRYYTESEIDTKLTNKSDKTHNHDSVYDAKGSANNALASAKEYTDTKTSGLASTSSVNTSISTHNTSTSAHSDIRALITDLTTKLNKFLDVDDTTSDQLSEILIMIENNKGTLESLTTSKINVSDIVNNLTTNTTSKVLSAAQGVAIKTLIDALEAELDSHTSNKSNPHGVTKAQVGLGNVDNTADANKSVKYATNAGSAAGVVDKSTGATTTFNYGASGITNPDWLAAWNGYELRATQPSKLKVGSATTADSATNATQLGGIAASGFVHSENSGTATISTSANDTPLVVKGNSATGTYIRFNNNANTALGWLGIHNNKPIFYDSSNTNREIITSATIGSQSVASATKATQDANGNTISTYYMKRGTYERIQGTSSAHKNLNDYTDAGFYNVKTAYVDNCPSGIGIDAVLLVYDWDSGKYECQEITETAASTTQRRWIRHSNAGTWTAWTEMASTSYVDSAISTAITTTLNTAV